MSLAKLIEAGLIESGVPDIFHDDAIHQIMSAIDDEIETQLRSTGKVDLPFEDDLSLHIDFKIKDPIGMHSIPTGENN